MEDRASSDRGSEGTGARPFRISIQNLYGLTLPSPSFRTQPQATKLTGPVPVCLIRAREGWTRKNNGDVAVASNALDWVNRRDAVGSTVGPIGAYPVLRFAQTLI